MVSLTLIGNELYKTDLENLPNDAFLETVAWLKKCKKLQNLALTMFSSAPVIAPILLEKSIHLTSFEYEGSGIQDTAKFYQMLANQTSLQRLSLTGNVGEHALEADVLVESLSKLINLTHLGLEEISESFVDRHIVQLAGSLPKLEVWWTNASSLTDIIWGKVATLRVLQRLHLTALMSFTTDGILDFIEKLGPGNKGLVLSVTTFDMNCDFFVELTLIKETIAKKVEGRFEFILSTHGYYY